MSYEIAYTEVALEAIKKIPEEERPYFFKGIEVLKENPYHEQSFAIRQDNATYRDIGITPKILITYSINDALVIVTVVRVILAPPLLNPEGS
jgi:mRNA-degrading endonuclease RelE of RelBE toxin-antitoxin system